MRLPNENFLAYCQRMTQAVEKKEITYSEWAKEVASDTTYSDETLRRASKLFSKFLAKAQDEGIKDIDSDAIVKSIEHQKNELAKERKRLQTVNAEYQERLRQEARQELFDEKIKTAIDNLEPIAIKTFTHIQPTENVGLLALSDFHAGSDYCVKGLNGEIVNQYSFEIMETRMWNLLSQLEADLDYVLYDKLHVALLGDEFENILRLSSLAKLKEPVIDTVIKFSQFMCVWLSEAHNRLMCPIEVISVGGNHDTMAILGTKPRMEEENLAKIVTAFLELRFADVEDITIDPYTDVAYKDIMGMGILFDHGTDSNLQATLEYFDNLYGVTVDELYAGHYHRPESKAVGISDLGDRTVYRVGSVCGVDPYAKSVRKSARPSAYFAIYNRDGHGWSRNYYL